MNQRGKPFLTFLCACVPGAGQMYYGYMQRGLSLIGMFMGCLALSSLLFYMDVVFIAMMAVVWMFSFFDTYDLLRHMAAGQPKQDGVLLVGDVTRWLPEQNRRIGWLLIIIGVGALYNSLLRNCLQRLLSHFINSQFAWELVDALPNLFISLFFIAAGAWLLGFRPAPKAAPKKAPPKVPMPESRTLTPEELDDLVADLPDLTMPEEMPQPDKTTTEE